MLKFLGVSQYSPGLVREYNSIYKVEIFATANKGKDVYNFAYVANLMPLEAAIMRAVKNAQGKIRLINAANKVKDLPEDVLITDVVIMAQRRNPQNQHTKKKTS